MIVGFDWSIVQLCDFLHDLSEPGWAVTGHGSDDVRTGFALIFIVIVIFTIFFIVVVSVTILEEVVFYTYLVIRSFGLKTIFFT